MYQAVDAHLGFKYESTIARAKLERVCDSLIEVSKSAKSMDEGVALAREAFERWHTDLAVPYAWRSKALGRVYAFHLFAGHPERDRAEVRRCLANVVRYDPAWLRNAGVWSIGTEAVLGHRLAKLLRLAARTGFHFGTRRRAGG
jgi:hypothetical protein